MANNNRATGGRKSQVTQVAEPDAPIAPSNLNINTEAPGALSVPNSRGASTSSKGGDENRGTGRDKGEGKADAGLSDLTTRLLQKADQLTNTINAKAIGRFEASEEWMMALIDGTADHAALIARYGLTNSVDAQEQLLELEQLGNSIKIAIEQKNVHILALKDQRKTLEISEEEAKLGGQVQDTADAIDNTRHKQVMTQLQMQIRSHKERGKQAQEFVAGRDADKKCVKRAGILATMRGKGDRNKEQEHGAATPQQEAVR